MQISKTMFLAVALLLTPIASARSFAQDAPTDPNENELATAPLEVKCRLFRDDQKVINDAAEWKTLLDADRDCGDEANLKIDFQKYTLIVVNVFADCHAEVSLRVTRNNEKKSYTVTVSEKYGGCRGMSLHNRSVLVEKLPPGYTVQFKAESRKQ